MSLPQEILDALESLVDQRFDELIRSHKINAEVLSADLTTFESEQMPSFDGQEKIDQGFFRKFLRWLSNYINAILASSSELTLDSVRYITPVDYDPVPDCGKIIAPLNHLVIEGTGVLPEIPSPATLTPGDIGFDPSVNIMEGALAYNKTDNLWFYRGSYTIYNLKDALSLGIIDIDGLTEALGAFVAAEEGKGLSSNDFTDEDAAVIADAISHMNIENIHLPPDGTTIEQTNDDALGVIPQAIIDLFSADLPLAIDANGKITLAIDDTTLDIVDGKLTVIGGGGGGDAKLSFVPETGILSVDPGGDASVDLSSLAAGTGVDLSNYVKKTGETSQTISGGLKVTGEIEPFA